MRTRIRGALVAWILVSSISAAPFPDVPTYVVQPVAVSARESTVSINPLLAEDRLEVADAGKRSLLELIEGCASSGDADAHGLPAAEALTELSLEPAPLGACCRVCSVGKACGNSCISRAFTCRRGVGCACDAAAVVPTARPTVPRPPDIQPGRQSAFPRVRVGDTTELTLDLNVGTALWLNGDVEMRVSNADEAGRGLRGWDGTGTIGINRGVVFGSSTQQFRAYVQGLAPGVHRLRVAFFHRTSGQVGPDGIYWDVSVDAISGVARLYDGWHSSWVSQSPYLSMHPGQIADFWIRFANVGTEAWDRGVWGRQVNLALNGDDKAPYRLGMAVNWLWDDRIATTTALRVRPGEIAEFRFAVRAPVSPGVYLLNLRPVVDGTVWLEDEGVFWVVEVR